MIAANTNLYENNQLARPLCDPDNCVRVEQTQTHSQQKQIKQIIASSLVLMYALLETRPPQNQLLRLRVCQGFQLFSMRTDPLVLVFKKSRTACDLCQAQMTMICIQFYIFLQCCRLLDNLSLGMLRRSQYYMMPSITAYTIN